MCFLWLEVYQVLGGRVLALASVTWRWCVETCIPVRPCFFLAAWLACCHTQPADDWELVFRGRTRCAGQKWWLRKRLPCIFFCCEHNVKWKWLSERTAPEDLNTCKDINGQTHSYCGKFHLRRVWFLAHFYTYRHTMRGYSFFMSCQQKAEHIITELGSGGGWSIPFSPSQLKWVEEELRQRRGDEWTWGNCPNEVEWFPNGRKTDMDEQAGGWTDRFTVTTTGAPF